MGGATVSFSYAVRMRGGDEDSRHPPKLTQDCDRCKFMQEGKCLPGSRPRRFKEEEGYCFDYWPL